MNAAPERVKFTDKLRVFLACIVAVGILHIVGWHVARPIDPDLAITLSSSGQSFITTWFSLLVLTAVTAAIGTAIVGRRLPEAGIFAAAVGLTGLALRSGSMQQVLGFCVTGDTESRRSLMLSLALDAIGWASILAGSWVVVHLAWQWLWGCSQLDKEQQSNSGNRCASRDNAQGTSSWAGWPALIITLLIAIFVIWICLSRTPVAKIARGQVIASVAAGLFLGAMIARYFTGTADARWYILAPLAVALIGYALGYINSDMVWAESSSAYKYYAYLDTTPPHDLARPLPIEYIAVGVAGALAGFWSGEKIELVAEQEAG